MNRKLYVSMMCADLSNLSNSIEEFDQAKIDGFHMDIMDGVFVNNFALGLEDVKAVRKLTNNLVDAHLMVTSPSNVIDIFLNLNLQIIYLHSEVQEDIIPVLQKIRDRGIKSGLAINPQTTTKQVIPYLPYVDKLLVMTVTPGFAGQAYQEFVDDKIKELISLKSEYPFEIVVDGAISPQRISYLTEYGVDGFVLGTSSTLFKPENNYTDVIKYLHSV